MPDRVARKKLFSETHRRRPYVGVPRARLLGGQAMAQAQRLSQPSMKPAVLGYVLFALDLLAVTLGGMISPFLVDTGALGTGPRLMLVWMAALMVATSVRATGGYGFRQMRELGLSLELGVLSLLIGLGLSYVVLLLAGLPRDELVTWIFVWGALSLASIVANRVGMVMRIRKLVRSGVLEHRIVLVGGGTALEPLIREIERERGKGRRMCGFFDERMGPRSPTVVAGHHKMGDIDELVEFARHARIDTVIIAIPDASQRRISELLSRLFVLPVDIRVLDGAEIPEFSRARHSRIGPFELIEIYKPPIGGIGAFQKRAFDIAFSIAAIIGFAPVMALVALAIRLESPGPVLFRQRRHGYNNKPIEVLKFRSMYTDQCDPTAVRQVRRDDNRVTRVGRFIRRSSLDELPQFFNVLKGDLSLVGPRPHALSARTGDIVYDQITEAYSARHKVKPGVTGWAQVNGWRGEMNSPEKIAKRVEFDLYYIEHWSVWLDLKILLMTPWSLVVTKNAY